MANLQKIRGSIFKINKKQTQFCECTWMETRKGRNPLDLYSPRAMQLTWRCIVGYLKCEGHVKKISTLSDTETTISSTYFIVPTLDCTCDRKRVSYENQCGRGDEEKDVRSDAKVWEAVWCSRGEHIPWASHERNKQYFPLVWVLLFRTLIKLLCHKYRSCLDLTTFWKELLSISFGLGHHENMTETLSDLWLRHKFPKLIKERYLPLRKERRNHGSGQSLS